MFLPHGRRIHPGALAAALVGICIASSAAAGERAFAEHGCSLRDGETGVVAAILDPTSFQLADGLVVRLAAVTLVPPADEAAATAHLETLALGQTVILRYGSLDRDRYGRATVHAFLAGADATWLQAALVEAGLAIVSGLAEDRACLAALLEHERLARAGAAGLWATRTPIDAWSQLIRNVSPRYELVEGLVVSIGRTTNTVYLNFGNDWSVDLTVTIAAADARRIEAEGGPLDMLAGQRVRVRGWLEQWDGPWIRVDHAEQIEILDR